MWPWSRNSECGSATEAAAVFAPPAGNRTVAFSLGWLPRWVPPKRRRFSLGLKGSSEQEPTWKGLWALKIAPPVPLIAPATAFWEQLVGLIVVSGRSTLSLTSRTRRITPWRIVGKGSDTALTWVVSGST